MNTSLLKCIPITLFLACNASSLNAQSVGTYDLKWNTLDGAGGTCAGGSFTLSGTLGQPDASPPSIGGNFSLIGGFWTAEPEVGPPLRIVHAGGSVIISWTASAAGFRLEHCAALGHMPRTTHWVNNTSTAFTFGDEKVVVEPAGGIRFYRLVKP